MHIIAVIVLLAAALAAFLSWYVATPRPRPFASLSLAVCLLCIGIILVFVLQGDPRWVVN